MNYPQWENRDRLPEEQGGLASPGAAPPLLREESRPILPGRVWSGLVLSLLISVASLGAVFWFTGKELSWRSVAVFPWRCGLLALGLLLAGWLADSFRWWLLVIILGGRVRGRDLWRIIFAGHFMSCVTPFASGGGPVQIYALAQQGLSVGQGTAVVVASGLVNQLVLAAGALFVTLAFDFTQRALGPWTDAAVYLYISGLTVYLVAVLNTEWFLRVIAALARRLGLNRRWTGERGTRIRQKFLKAGADFHQALRLLCGHPGPLALASLSTVLFYVLLFSIAPVLLQGLGAPVPFWQAQGLQVVFWLLFSLMPTPGGSGAAELGFVAVFTGLVPSTFLPPLAVAWRLLTFYLRLLVGWPCFVATLGRRQRPSRSMPSSLSA